MFLALIVGGIYIAGAIGTFVFVGLFSALGGSDKDLWRPLKAALLWPVALPRFLRGRTD